MPSSTFRETEGSQGAPLAQAASQMILIQNKQYAIVGYLGATCPGPHIRHSLNHNISYIPWLCITNTFLSLEWLTLLTSSPIGYLKFWA